MSSRFKFAMSNCEVSSTSIVDGNEQEAPHVSSSSATSMTNGKENEQEGPIGSTTANERERNRCAPDGPGQLTTIPNFLTKVKVVNTGSIRRKVIRQKSLGILSLTGGKGTSAEEDGVGKSSLALSLMLGLGIDLLPATTTTTASSSPTMCGLYPRVRNGKKRAYVALTMSLDGFPALEQQYGTHMKFARTFVKEERSSSITLSSADPDISSAIRPHIVEGPELASIFEGMKLSSDSFRLIFLNQENVDYLIEHQEVWCSFLDAAIDSDINSDLHVREMTFLLERFGNAEKRMRMTAGSLKEQIRTDTELTLQLETPGVTHAMQNDEAEHTECQKNILKTIKDRLELHKKWKRYADTLRCGLLETCVTRMLAVFNEFLEQVNLSGHIIIQSERNEVAFCVWGMSAEKTGLEFEDVKQRWKNMSRTKKELAMIGFCVALWEVSDYLPLLVADVMSTTWDEGLIPPRACPVLLKVLNKKSKEGKQCFVSLPSPIRASPSPEPDAEKPSSSTM